MPAKLPLPIALSCGDPAGIGPEIAWKAWQVLRAEEPFFWIGDPRHLPDDCHYLKINDPEETHSAAPHGLPVVQHEFAETSSEGMPSAANAKDVVAVIRRGVDLVGSNKASAICTAPISKKILRDYAGFAFPGHTEYLADLAGVSQSVMMLVAGEFRVVPATVHIPISNVANALTESLLEETLRITHKALKYDFGISEPRLVVAGLNPHAGEGGMLGTEERELIEPLCRRLKNEGLDVRGPLPADTMFHEKARQSYDAAVAMFHDQALIPIKTIAFDRGVNTTLGLPFVRTSPDHGTAFDIAGKNIADPTSLIAALRLAAQMARTRSRSTR
ncbi:MAG: 4-hydroxythreonine-4-phosphate dehydrogenase PdxA [Boseongicola sp.]